MALIDTTQILLLAKIKSDSGSGPGFSKFLDYGFGSE